MATTTTNYGLTKPGYGDTADIADINGNMDDIDASLGAKDGALALVNDGDTASQNIAEGKYVYVRGHSTLAEGLYTASSAIASGDTLSSSNLTAASDVLNTLNASFIDYSSAIDIKSYVETGYVAPQNGFVYYYAAAQSGGYGFSLQLTVNGYVFGTNCYNSSILYIAGMIPVRKGDAITRTALNNIGSYIIDFIPVQ